MPAPVYEWRNAKGDTLIRFGRDSERSLSGWPESSMFCQPELESILDERVRQLPNVSVERGCEAVALCAAPDAVEIGARRADGNAAQVRSRFAVGCDGANSFVRLPHETLEELNSEATAWRLLETWGMRPGNAKLERHAVYTFRARWADRWRNGRAFIAGDAAHQVPPFAGQGMCAGMRDAANLAWKLDLVLAGRAGEALLDSYPSERATHVDSMIQLSVALGRVICVADPEEAAARDLRMAAEARERRSPLETQLPALGPGCLAAGSRAAGQLFVQDQVRAGARAGLFDDVVGRGFALVSPHGDPSLGLDAGLAAWFGSLGGVTAHVAKNGAIVDLHSGYARWFGAHAVAVVLQRPDGYVFGSAPKLEDAGSLLAALRERLTRLTTIQTASGRTAPTSSSQRY